MQHAEVVVVEEHLVHDAPYCLLLLIANRHIPLQVTFHGEGLRWSLDFELLVDQYVAYLEIMAHFRKVLPGRVYDVRYEDLVEDPERVMRGVLKHIGLSWEASILEFYRMNRTVQTHSSSQVRQRLYSSSIGGWTKYAAELTPMIKLFRKYLPRLKKQGALPFPKKINWRMDPNFPYPGRSNSYLETEVDITGTKSSVSGRSLLKKHARKTRRNPKEKRRMRKRKAAHKKQRKTKEKSTAASSASQDMLLLDSLKPHCYMNINFPDQQAITISKSFDYEVTNLEVAKLVACSYVCIRTTLFL